MGENEVGRGESVTVGNTSQGGSPEQFVSGGRVPVLAAVVRRDGRYLVGRRPDHKRHGGLWEFPGGKLHAGESWLAAARREFGEEVEVLDVGRVLYSNRDPGSDFVIVFVEVTITGEPEAREHDLLSWATPCELRTMDLAPSDAAFIAQCPDLNR